MLALNACGEVSGTAQEPAGSTLAASHFRVPDDAERNENQTIGPFCCTGSTLTVRHVDGYAVGYLHFFFWDGNAFNLDDFAIFPNLVIDVAGLQDVGDSTSLLVMSQVTISPESNVLQLRFPVTAGALSYTLRLTQAELYPFDDGRTYFKGSTLALAADVSVQLR